MSELDPTSDLWAYAASFLPRDLDEMAFQTGALVRCREIDNAQVLLRVLLCCSQPGSSFQTASAWSASSGLAQISPEGLFYRMKHSEAFLSATLASLVLDWRNVKSTRRIVIGDRTSLCGPGSKGNDWRVHTLYDPMRSVPLQFLLTDCHTGETLSNYDLRPGDLVVADAGYGHFKGVQCALSKKADVLVRVTPCQMKLTDDQGKRIDLRTLNVPAAGCSSFTFTWHAPKEGSMSIRIIGIATLNDGVCWLATNLSPEALSDQEASELYRFRWQIELLFKRLKSLLHLDELRSREGPTSKAFIYAKLITAVLALRLSNAGEDFSPYGYRVGATKTESLARVQVRTERPNSRLAGNRNMDSRCLVEA
jgi:hypothetical protein